MVLDAEVRQGVLKNIPLPCADTGARKVQEHLTI